MKKFREIRREGSKLLEWYNFSVEIWSFSIWPVQKAHILTNWVLCLKFWLPDFMSNRYGLWKTSSTISDIFCKSVVPETMICTGSWLLPYPKSFMGCVVGSCIFDVLFCRQQWEMFSMTILPIAFLFWKVHYCGTNWTVIILLCTTCLKMSYIMSIYELCLSYSLSFRRHNELQLLNRYQQFIDIWEFPLADGTCFLCGH